MSDNEAQNKNEEEYEEGNIMNINQNENQEDEEAQDVYAYDIQINDDSYLLIIGKTEENKILLRLIDKEDQTKPFFQNEFSLNDLRNINPIFNNVDDEDIAFQYLVSNLNDAEKEIKIIDESKIKFIIIILDEDEKVQIDFLLFKSIEEELNENEAEGEEDIMEEAAAEIINDEIDKNKKIKQNESKKEENVQPQKEIKKEKKEIKNNHIKEQINSLEIKNSNNKNNEEFEKKLNNNINLVKEELLNVINNMNETFENKILVQNESFNKIKEDIIKENDKKINDLKAELNSKENEIEKLNNTITNLEQKLNIYEGRINDINNKLNNFEDLITNLNNQNLNIEINDINNKLNKFEDLIANLNNQNKNLENVENNLNEKILNDLKENISLIDNKIIELKKEYENNRNNNDIKILDEKINNLDNKIQLNINKNGEKENEKFINLENKIENLETKINKYELDQLIDSIAILTEKQKDTKIYEAINNLETQINEIKEKLNKQGKESNIESISNKKNNNDQEIMNKINNQENIISALQSQLKKLEEEKNNENATQKNLEKTLSDVIKKINDFDSKIESLFTITKNLSNENDELKSKTNNILSNMSKISTKISAISPKTSHQENIISRANYHRPIDNQVQNNQNLYYNKTTPNINTHPKFNINSNIINLKDILFIINRIKEIHPKLHNINLLLVYRASEDGDRAKDFHRKCDKIGPNIVIIKTRKGNIFGGFTFKNWEHMPRDIDESRPNLGSASRDSKAFGFNVNNQKIYNNEKPNEFAIWCNKNYGPTFKNNLFQIFDNCLKKGGYCSVKNNSHFGGQMEDYEIAGGESRFRVEELEVFEIKTK